MNNSLNKKSVLLIGSGGREHALAWKLAQSPTLSELWIAPGNPGTASLGNNIAIEVEDIDSIVRFAKEHIIDLVVVGPEAPLSLGLVDRLRAIGVAAFGPTQAAAQIETSKEFSKKFMRRHAIPTASFEVFSDIEEAVKYVEAVSTPIVIKASGLAAGKGVFLPNSHAETHKVLEDLLVHRLFGEAGRKVIIEERLSGEEVSLLAFTDGNTILPMPPAQDHKRLLEGDSGPNTGGMGAYAPAPICPPEMVGWLTEHILQPTIDGLRTEGIPYTGVLYAGIIFTKDGPQVLEFNCRFGDPETQVILPLLEDDFVQIAYACANGTLHLREFNWKNAACACVVLAAKNYPESGSKGQIIQGLNRIPENSIVFHAGTRIENNMTVTHGGRILGATGWGNDLHAAIKNAYQAVSAIQFDGMQFRSDIGDKGLQNLSDPSSAYSAAGVNIDAGNRAVSLMRKSVRSTYTPAVLAGIGAFGGLFDASEIKRMQNPVLVASTDGIGTKVMLAAKTKRYRNLGHDIVNHCTNDILVQGARPLFFLDYFATSKLDPEITAAIVTGMSEACCESGCVLIGGETAEMPGVYQAGEFDIAGTMIGVVEKDQILPKNTLAAGDLLIGLRSSGPHTNGYSLLRHIFQNDDLSAPLPGTDMTLGDALLAPHRSYLPILYPLINRPDSPVKALAHITGGGLLENIPRILPNHLEAQINGGSWPVPPIFTYAQQRGMISDQEMARVFNLGIGMLLIANRTDFDLIQSALGETSWIIGELAYGNRKVVLI